MISGANAKRDDTVRNLTTGRIGRVIGTSQFGRIWVRIPPIDPTRLAAAEKWERTDCEVIPNA